MTSTGQTIQQLAEVLQGPLTLDNIATSYAIRFGKSINTVLRKIYGQETTLLEFILMNPTIFQINNETVILKNMSVSTVSSFISSPKIGGGGGGTCVVTDDISPGSSSSVGSPGSSIKYADVSRWLRTFIKDGEGPISVSKIEESFTYVFGVSLASIVGVPTIDYVKRKGNMFLVNEEEQTVYLQPSILAGPPIQDPNTPKDERFVVNELEQLIMDSETHGHPVCYISSLCGKFIQRNGVSVASIVGGRPLDLFKRHSHRFITLSGGNVTLPVFKNHPEVLSAVELSRNRAGRVRESGSDELLLRSGKTDSSSLARAVSSAGAVTSGGGAVSLAGGVSSGGTVSSSGGVSPEGGGGGENIDDQTVVEEFKRLILQDSSSSVYISSLCGRFLQKYGHPVSNVISSRPADFLRKYPDIFVMTGGGNVGLRQVLGDEAENAPAPPPRESRKRDMAERVDRRAQQILTKVSVSVTTFSDILESISQISTIKNHVENFVNTFTKKTFLSINNVYIGGALGAGLTTTYNCSSDICLYMEGLPHAHHRDWMQSLLECVIAIIEICYSNTNNNDNCVTNEPISTNVYIQGSSVRFIHETVELSIYISPIYTSSAQIIAAARDTPPAERWLLDGCFVEEATEFVASQPTHVKEAIQLMHLWKRKQVWSSATTTPSDYLISLAVICQNNTTMVVGDLVNSTLLFLAEFSKCNITEYPGEVSKYCKSDIWIPLLKQSPLLIDPVNPFKNVADPMMLDYVEMAELASGENALNAFKKEATKLPHFTIPPDWTTGDVTASSSISQNDQITVSSATVVCP
eukprot:GHVL01045045.1.p1 GENE.GHVL01045045.1~~GHVL01045045.1.p1  ORF type:complete len:806 (-),score=205.22 GHVL01045045.1:67-2484(-)